MIRRTTISGMVFDLRMLRIIRERAAGERLATAAPCHFDSPSHDGSFTMNWVAQVLEGGLVALSKQDPSGREEFKRAHGRLEGQSTVLVSEDHNELHPRKLRVSKLGAVGERASMLRVRREDVHEHVVVGLSIFAHQAKELAFHEQLAVRFVSALARAVEAVDARSPIAVNQRTGVAYGAGIGPHK
jgi:hypothetical protein